MTSPSPSPHSRWATGFLVALGPGVWLAIGVILLWETVSMISGNGDGPVFTLCQAQGYLNPLRHGPFIMAYLYLLPWALVFALTALVLLAFKRTSIRTVLMVLMASVLAWGLPLLIGLTPLAGTYDRALVRCIDDRRADAADLSDIVTEMLEEPAPAPAPSAPPAQPSWEEMEPWVRAWAYKSELNRFCGGEEAEENGIVFAPDEWADEIAAVNAEVAAEFEGAEAEYVCTPEMFEETDQRVEEAAMALGKTQTERSP